MAERQHGGSAALNRAAFVVGALFLFLPLATFFVVALATHPFDSPFHHAYAQALHGFVWSVSSGTDLGSEWDDYTGVVRLWDDRGKLTAREQYVDGQRHGVWIDYSPDDEVERVHEYRNGRPWNGVCNTVHLKAFRCEYRDGVVWNGVPYAHWSEDEPAAVINGRPVTVAEFAEFYEIDGAVDPLFIRDTPVFTERQLRQPLGIALPMD